MTSPRCAGLTPATCWGSWPSLSDQVIEGWRISRGLELPWDPPRSVAILGMGGSAIGGDLVKGIWSDRLSVPVEVIRGYELPAWVGPDTLVIASSKSGSTEETLSALETALSRRCPVVAIELWRRTQDRGTGRWPAHRDLSVGGFAAFGSGLLDGHRGWRA